MSSSNPIVSIIFPVKNEGINVKNTLDSLVKVKTDFSYEVIIVDDASEDACCEFLSSHEYPITITLVKTDGLGAANARNVGSKKANGKYYIFCDAHLFYEDYWMDKLIEPMEVGIADGVVPGIAPHDKPNIVGYGYTINLEKFKANFNGQSILTKGLEPVETPCLPGGCLAIKKDVFFDIGGFDKGFIVWGHEDIEISIKMWLFGYKCFIQPQVKVLHIFRKSFPYTVKASHTDYNLMRMAYSHFSEERIEKCKKYIQIPEKTDQIVKSVIDNGVLEQRANYSLRRKFDDDWFFQKFHINF
ncbi:glycosyltransferase family 2 protein [Brevibacillus sp. SIMBA_040]|uniref:glycosyltransferase family 2 protein n=1 Tax=unclassified Brevibacillus TaxID=2684853 RepID=UPI00397CF977